MKDRQAYYRKEEIRAAREERFEDAARWRDMAEHASIGSELPKELFPTQGVLFITGIRSPAETQAMTEWMQLGLVNQVHECNLKARNEGTATRNMGKRLEWAGSINTMLREILKAPDSELRAQGVWVIDHLTSKDEFFFKGVLVFVVDYVRDCFGRPGL